MSAVPPSGHTLLYVDDLLAELSNTEPCPDCV